MTLIAAIKSGRPFRRRGKHDRFSEPFGPGIFSLTVTQEDILADDWEIQEPEVRITRTQFWAAYSEAQCDLFARPHLQSVGGYSFEEHSFLMAKLAERLGLEMP
jgi:hypothetical protein